MDISVLLGKILTEVHMYEGADIATFITDEGKKYQLWHNQDCCESVRIYDITGDPTDLVGSPITMAEESTNSDDKMEIEYMDSFTWTFYRLATIKGYVTIRWLGESNGYYSESVEFMQIE